MATKKKLLQAAAGSASGGEGLNVEDVFSTYLYEGNGSKQTIDNGIGLGEGGVGSSVYFDGTDDYLSIASDASLGFGTGDFTIECWIYPDTVPTTYLGIVTTLNSPPVNGGVVLGTDSSGNITFTINSNSGTTITANTTSTKYAANQWQHLALTRESGTVRVWLDGTQIGTDKTDTGNAGGTVPALVSSFYTNSTSLNFDGYISNLRFVKGTALYTSNFTPSTEPLTNITNTSLLTCQSSSSIVDNSDNSHTVTAINDARASAFGPFDGAYTNQGGLVWIKNRETTDWHALFDTERGVGIQLASNDTRANYSLPNALNSFNSTGFSLGNDSSAVNSNAEDYASWTFRKAPKFFDVVKTSGGDGTATTHSHNLGSEPAFIIGKKTSGGSNWFCYHRSLGAGKYINLNSTDGVQTSDNMYPSTGTYSSTEFSVGGTLNGLFDEYVFYLFAHNDGDGEFGPTGDQDIIKCGSYTGTGAAGNFVDLGFEPQWVLTKRTDSANSWILQDNMRNMSHSDYAWLYTNASNAEATGTVSGGTAAAVPNGYVINNTGGATNAAGATYIYIAIRRGPMAVPTDATDVFDVQLANATTTNGVEFETGWPVDFAWFKDRDTGTEPFTLLSRLQGDTRYMYSSSTAAEASGVSNGTFDHSNGWYSSTLPTDYYSCMWRRAPNFFDVVAYTGNGTAGRTVSHNLGVAPEMIWVKRRNLTEDFFVYHSDLGANYNLRVNKNLAANNQGTFPWNATAPTDSVFTVYNDAATNGSGSTYIAYLFASLDGVSKVGSYTGTGSAQTIDCGFSSGARFVLIKRADSTSDWRVFDTERGIVVGTDPFLELNTTDAENNSFDMIRPDSSGFIAYNNSVNGSSGTYIFYAIA